MSLLGLLPRLSARLRAPANFCSFPAFCQAACSVAVSCNHFIPRQCTIVAHQVSALACLLQQGGHVTSMYIHAHS